MKKFTKILIALGAAGIAKYIYDHVDIVTNKELEERIKKEAEVIAKEKAYNNIWNEVGKCASAGVVDGLNKAIPNPEEHSGHYTIGYCDHVYYDNPYNISKIHLDKNGCPQVFEFENKKDRDKVLNKIHLDYIAYDALDVRSRWTLEFIFDYLGLIIDDYIDFKNRYVCWPVGDLQLTNSENAIPKTINFGKFEK